jgi:hypothetical protein
MTNQYDLTKTWAVKLNGRAYYADNFCTAFDFALLWNGSTPYPV